MDSVTILTSVSSSLGVSATAAWWLSKTLISHRLEKEMEDYKSEWSRELQRERLEMEGKVRERVETILGERAAEREYLLEARKRLYLAIGPLKFQLLIACRDIAKRIEGHGFKAAYSMKLSGYYGSNTLYRLLRPLAIAELIERQITCADFAVEESALDLLRFKKSAFHALTGGSLMCNHPQVDWKRQSQHVFYDTLTEAANALIASSPDGNNRVLRYEEFCEMDFGHHGLASLAVIVDDFTIKSKPLFWVRLIAVGHICREFLGKTGTALGFEYRSYNIQGLLTCSEDAYILENIDAFKNAVKDAVLEKL